MLETLGLSQAQEAVYTKIVESHEGTSPEELCTHLDLDPDACSDMLTALESKGFVTRLTSGRPRFVAAPPSVVLDSLLLRKQAEIDSARAAVVKLDEIFRAGSPAHVNVELVEVLRSRELVVERFVQLQRTTKSEILVLDKPPYAVEPTEPNPLELELLERGIRCRAIYDRDAVTPPGRLSLLNRMVELGEEARVLSGLPTKLALSDSRMALIPLNVDSPGMEGAVVIHRSSLLDALRMLFEILWERAVPLGGRGSNAPVADETQISSVDSKLLQCLASGMTDAVIAREMATTERTVRRRVRRLMDSFGAQTRFQAGMQAARRGWL
jgi:sugar-specific transcriptional regulator TrmB/DNA-binding CsgD family transcriptional regulator